MKRWTFVNYVLIITAFQTMISSNSLAASNDHPFYVLEEGAMATVNSLWI